MEQPPINIIVPIYSAEPHLDNCPDSIAAQIWENLGVWLVDGGPIDASPALCGTRTAADSRLHVLHQANVGVSAARSTALERAAGQYLQLMDGNGYLPFTTTERLVHTAGATGAGLVIDRFWRVVGTHEALQGHIHRERVFTHRGFAEGILKAPTNLYHGALWNRLYRRSIAEKGGLRYDPKVSWCEDFLLSLECIRRARLIAATAQPVYCCVKRPGSLVTIQTTLVRVVEMERTMFAAYKQLYQTLDLYDGQKLQVYGYLVSAVKNGGSMALRPSALPKRHARPSCRWTRWRRTGIV